MPVVLRTRPSTVAVILALAVVVVPLVAADGPTPPWWATLVVWVAIGAGVARTRAEIGPVHVRVVGLGAAVQAPRHGIVAVHAAGGRRRPAFVALDDGTTFRVPVLLSSQRLARALAVPHLSWAGDRELDQPPPARWVAAVGIALLAVAVAMTVGFSLAGR